MNEDGLDALRNHYDTTDLTSELETAELDTEIEQSPMVGITVRFPAEVLQQVRAAAAAVGVKPTALIRKWVEQQLNPRKSQVATSAVGFTQLFAGGTAFFDKTTRIDFPSALFVSRHEEHFDAADTDAFVRRAAELAATRG
ncbi:hypothetical protein MycrhDRAFT_6663 [Mycolicibacterium rhodesiae JS60]|nr:hypothetical protein MycrhDRAFT_6663 [Mycolicibacterium rhodesiae JS60]